MTQKVYAVSRVLATLPVSAYSGRDERSFVLQQGETAEITDDAFASRPIQKLLKRGSLRRLVKAPKSSPEPSKSESPSQRKSRFRKSERSGE